MHKTRYLDLFSHMVRANTLGQAILLHSEAYTALRDFWDAELATLLVDTEAISTSSDYHVIRPIDKARTIHIDAIRDITPWVHTRPTNASKRVIVIEPADTMTLPAANALLKILEEPGEYVLWVLLAREIDGIPMTIRSRCRITYIQDSGDIFKGVISQSKILEDILSIQAHPSILIDVARQWAEYDIDKVLIDVYQFCHSMLHAYLVGEKSPISHRLLLNMTDRVQTYTGYLRNHVAVHPQGVIESVLGALVV